MPHSYLPVIVTWNDAWSSQCTFTKEEAEAYKPVIMQEIGFLVSNTTEGVTTCASVHTEDGSLRYPNFIPLRMIESVVFLQPRTVPVE